MGESMRDRELPDARVKNLIKLDHIDSRYREMWGKDRTNRGQKTNPH